MCTLGGGCGGKATFVDQKDKKQFYFNIKSLNSQRWWRICVVKQAVKTACIHIVSPPFSTASFLYIYMSFSTTLDNTPSASARCKLAIALPSISFHLPSSVISSDLSPIAAKQLSFLKTAFILIFHNEKLFPLNFSISYFVAIIEDASFPLTGSNRSMKTSYEPGSDTTVRPLWYGAHNYN